MSFTSIRDLNLEIMGKMDDRTLLNVRATNKYGRELCQNESFWHKRMLDKYGEMATKNKPENRTWKNHYMQIVIDTHSYSPPAHILSRVIWDPRGPEYSTYVTPALHKRRFLKAPEQFLNAFYLMNLGPDFANKTAFQIVEEKAKETKDTVVVKDLFVDYRLHKNGRNGTSKTKYAK